MAPPFPFLTMESETFTVSKVKLPIFVMVPPEEPVFTPFINVMFLIIKSDSKLLIIPPVN